MSNSYVSVLEVAWVVSVFVAVGCSVPAYFATSTRGVPVNVRIRACADAMVLLMFTSMLQAAFTLLHLLVGMHGQAAAAAVATAIYVIVARTLDRYVSSLIRGTSG